ncbi:MAG TPA: hypothetical protein VN814_09910 [Caulobacteraceae bacterium]|nr:hypothetical protein [Caulobacteraceae bacterium]
MGQLSEAKLGIVRRLIEQAPDSAVRNLLRALGADGPHDAGLTRVQQMLEAEAADRNARNTVFAPIAPLCAAPGPFSGLTFPPRTLALLWKALKQEAPSAVDAAKAYLCSWRSGDALPEMFDQLCTRAALGLRATGGAFAAAADAADEGAGRERLAGCLDIASLTRYGLEQAPEWLGRMNGEKAAKLRLTYRDVCAVADDAGPRFFEMLTAHLTEPWLILRVIAGVMDHPHETYASGSELAGFGERVLGDIDRRLAEIAAFKAASGRQAAHVVAQTVHQVTVELAEIEQSFQLAADGAWGRRVAKQKKQLAESIEAVLQTADRAVAGALPVQTVRIGPRTAKGVPRFTDAPDPDQVERAATVLTFVNEVRSSASAGGFASARAKALEGLEHRLDTYVEDVLAEIHADDGADLDRARAFLEIAAELCGLARDDKAAQIVRRRAAAA